MAVTADGWFDWAVRDPGPPHKVNGGTNGGRGMIPHSAEGYRKVLREILFGPRRASWHASNLKVGPLIQHYPVFAQTWTSGAGFPNNNFFTFETEGVAGEALTENQIDNLVRAGRDLMDFYGWHPRRPADAKDMMASLYEHNECTRWGAEGTSCPSGRIPWDIIIAGLEDTLASKEYDELMREIVEIKKLIGGLEIADGKEDDTQTGEIRSLFGYARAIRKDLDAHLAEK